jgi:hypothetical protein
VPLSIDLKGASEHRDGGTLAASIDLRFRALVLLGSYGGLRIGEMLGLRAERVDILRGRVDVAENLVEVAGRLYFGPPKTKAGRRVVPIPRVVCTALRTCSISDLASTLLGSRRSLGGRRASTTSRSQAHGRGPLDRRGRGSERDSCSRRTLVSSHRSGPVRTPASRVRASCKRCARRSRRSGGDD